MAAIQAPPRVGTPVNQPKSSYVVVGDCGGTNSRLSLWEIPLNASRPMRGEKAPGRLVYEKKYLNQEYDSFVSVMRTFIGEAKAKEALAEPEVACLACAGPIVNNSVQFTNIAKGWTIDGAVLSQSLGIPQVRLLNDFEAMGYGLLTLHDSECLTLHDVPPTPGGVIGTCGAGTGLGECFLTKDPNARNYVCWPTEGGHCDWSPRTDLEVELHQFLRKKYAHKHRVSQERVISGRGISDIYEFLSQQHADRIDAKVHDEWLKAGSLQGAVVGKNADTNELCQEAFRIFFEAFAKECGDACLKWLPTGGFYITGGIGAKNVKWLTEKTKFVDILFDKGRVSPALLKIPIRLVLTEDCGERGAHLFAYNLLTSVV